LLKYDLYKVLPFIFLTLLVLLLTVQLFYWFYYFLSINSFKIKSSETETQKPISIIICAHNELENIQKIIPVFLGQNYAPFELLIVDDRSEDGTYEYLDELKKSVSNLKTVHIEATPDTMDAKKYAITLGVKAASYPYLLFSDADCIPVSENWIHGMQSKFTECVSIVLGISKYESKKGFLNYFIQFETLYTAMQYVSFAFKGVAYMGVGRNLAYTKNIFFDNKGFHPYMDIVGGDDDLFIGKVSTNHNVSIAWEEESQTISIPKDTWGDYIHQKTRHLSVGKLYKPKIKTRLGILNFSHLFYYLFSLCLFFLDSDCSIIVLGFLMVRWTIICTVYSLVAQKLKFKVKGWTAMIFDVIYPFYYIYIGVKAFKTKRIKWK
jgi:glycosyltransferase involved in cell wall biosynthesis